MTIHLDADAVRPYVRGQLFLDIVGRYTPIPQKHHAIDSWSHGGHTWNARCPLGCGSQHDALILHPDRIEPDWICNQGCSDHKRADIFAFVAKAEHLTFDESITRVAELAGLLTVGSGKPLPPKPLNPMTNFVQVDMTRWQEAAGFVTKQCADRLWSPVGKEARDYLLSRGLNEAALRNARIGYQAESLTMLPERWGLPVGGAYAIQAGITIPYVDDGGTVTAIKTRLVTPFRGRNGREVKYLHVPHGGAPVGVYGKYTDRKQGVAVLQEAELDALLGWQHQPAFTWLASPAGTRLHKGDVPPGVLIVAMDNDDAGRRATELILQDHPDALIAPPFPGGCKDLTEGWQREGHNAVTAWMRQVEMLLPEVTY